MPNELHERERPTATGETEATTDSGRATADPNRPAGSSEGETSGRSDRFDERLRAVERALTGSDADLTDVRDEAAAAAERAELESRLDEIESRVEELEAATQALRGYAGSIRAVNREVERRADLALARASGGDGVQRDERERERAAGGEIPSEDAIAAGVPGGCASDGDERDTEEKDSNRDGPLDRLRESV